MALDDFIIDLIECRQQGFNDEETAVLLDCPTEVLVGYETLLESSANNGKSLSKLDISPETKEQIEFHYSTKRVHLPKEQRIQEIRELAPIAENVSELAEAVDLAEATVRIYACKNGIKLPRISTQEQRIQEIRELAPIAENVSELAEAVGLAEATVKQYAYKNGIKLPQRHNHGSRRPEIDELITKGYSMQEIGYRVGSLNGKQKKLSRERIRQYIKGTGQHEEYRRIRELCTTQGTKEVRKELLRTLVEVAKQKCQEQKDPALEKAIEYYFSRKKITRKGPKQNISFEKVYKLFSSYFEAQEEETPLSYAALQDIIDIHYVQVGNILRFVGLKPMHHPNHKKVTKPSKEQIQAIERAYDLEMNIPDIAHFVGLPPYVIQQRFIKIGKRKKQDSIARRGRQRLDNRTASQIYEAQDAGFSEEETSELLGTHPDLVSHALQNKPTIETKIIEALNTIHPETEHQTPYLL